MKKYLKSEKGITRLTLLLLIIALLMLAGALSFVLYNKTQQTSQAENSKMNEVKNTTINETNASSKKSSKNKTSSEDSTPGFGEVNLDYVESFGKIVTGYTGYKAEEDDDEWRLFYADSDNAYLIKNSIENMNISSMSGYGRDMTSSDYTLGRSLNSKYTEKGNWALESSEGSINDNIKIMAALLDTTSYYSEWNDYKNSNANWVIGAPTLEMFIASYNATHEIQLDCTVEDSLSTGYKVKKKGDKDFGYYTFDLGNSSDLDQAIYCPEYGRWWLASPAAADDYSEMYVGFGVGGCVSAETSSAGCGIRPLVCVSISEIGNELKIESSNELSLEENKIINKTELLGDDTIGTGYYIEKDGEYAIIYADRLDQEGINLIKQTWNCDLPQLTSEEKENIKTYVISDETYEDKFFGKRNIIKLADDNTGTEDRFYAMTLENVKADNDEEMMCWYDADECDALTDYKFGTGKSNTEIMINKWNNRKYSEHDTNSQYKYVWGQIQEQANNGWFVPSMDEWFIFILFMENDMGLDSYNSERFGLNNNFWSSTLGYSYYANVTEFKGPSMAGDHLDANYCVRLSTTF